MERRYTTCNHTSTQRYVDFCEFEKALDWFNDNLRYVVYVRYRRRSEINADSFYEWIDQNTTGLWSRIQERSSVRFVFEKREDALKFQKTYIDHYADDVAEVGDEERDEDDSDDLEVNITVDDASDESDEDSEEDSDTEGDEDESVIGFSDVEINTIVDEINSIPMPPRRRGRANPFTVRSGSVHNYRMSNWDIASFLPDTSGSMSVAAACSNELVSDFERMYRSYDRMVGEQENEHPAEDTVILASGVRTPEPEPEPEPEEPTVRMVHQDHTIEFTREDYERITQHIRQHYRDIFGNNR